LNADKFLDLVIGCYSASTHGERSYAIPIWTLQMRHYCYYEMLHINCNDFANKLRTL